MSLYHRHRPQTFSELRGQEHVGTTLKRAVQAGRTTHAYLFTGPRGTGKTSTARILARALNCESPRDGDPCLKCASCQSLLAGTAIDLIEIDAASNRGIDEIRELRENVRFTPASLRYKVFIIDEVHMLTKEAFNALLKTLEEPPEHAVFILATTEIHKVPETVISRCQRFDFGRASVAELTALVEGVAKVEKVELADGVASAIAVAAEGGFRDALTLLEQLGGSGESVSLEEAGTVLSLGAEETAEKIYRALADSETAVALGSVSEYVLAGGDVGVLYRYLLRMSRYLLLLQLGERGSLEREVGVERLERLAGLTEKFDPERLIELAEAWHRASERRADLAPGLWLELAILRLAPAPSSEVREAAPAESTQSSSEASAAPAVSGPTTPPAPEQKPRPTRAGKAGDPEALTRLQGQWGEVIQAAKGHNHSVAACLQVAVVVSVEGDLVTLAFPYKFHRERIEEFKNRRIVEEVISELLGGSYRIESVLSEVKAPEGGDDLVRAALEILGGEVVA